MNKAILIIPFLSIIFLSSCSFIPKAPPLETLTCGTDLKISDGTKTQIWNSCNVGSSVVGLSSSSYGSYFKWGNKNSVNIDKSNWSEIKNNSSWNGNPCAIGYRIPAQEDWLFAYQTITKNESSNQEKRDKFVKTLRLPSAGIVSATRNGEFLGADKVGYYWASNLDEGVSSDILSRGKKFYYFLQVDGSKISPDESAQGTNGFSIRCIKE